MKRLLRTYFDENGKEIRTVEVGPTGEESPYLESAHEDYPDEAIELGRTFERQDMMEWYQCMFGGLPPTVKSWLTISLRKAAIRRQAKQKAQE